MSQSDFQPLFDAVEVRKKQVMELIFSDKIATPFVLDHLTDATLSYFRAGGKSLRPAVLMLACQAVGGDESKAVPAAAAVEIYHTFTLVHDDIIDRDDLRRGTPTVHAEFRDRGRKELGMDSETAEHYGLSVAILAGDIQQGWSISSLPLLYSDHGVSAELTLNLIREQFHRVQTMLIEGEALDVIFSQTPVEKLNADQVLDMLWKKTGILYEYAGRAGAAIGLNNPNLKAKMVEHVAQFTGKCGIAFQVQDDILALTADAGKLGKAVGNDILEGKRTLVVLGSLPNLDDNDREKLLATLGNQDASSSDVSEAIRILQNGGGIEYAQGLADNYLAEARQHLAHLPPTEARDLLEMWAAYMVERDY